LKKRIRKSVLMVLVAWAACSVFLLAITAYHKGPWRGKVIDAKTKQPIEGAAVVAEWVKDFTGPAGVATDFFDAAETRTDKNGEFRISSKWFINIIPFITGIGGPYFTIYKPGYGYFPRYQVSPQNISPDLFEGKGGVVELSELKLKTREEYLKYFPELQYVVMRDGDQNKIKYFIKLQNEEIKFENSKDTK